MKSTPPKIAVLGSINMDVVIRCEHLPQPGETIIATSSAEFPGGKGANQAVAAARLGGKVSMIGNVGNDAFAETLLKNLQQEDIDTTHIGHCRQCDSGLAVIAVEASSENSIMVVPGANAKLCPTDADAAADVIQSSQALLLQHEVPIETVIAAIRVAKNSDTRVILDPAPALFPFPSELFEVDLLCPNQTEARTILGIQIDSIESAKSAAMQLMQSGPPNVVITLGEHGALVANREGVELIPAFSIIPTDTTAAGDAFTAALAIAWCEDYGLREAARFASAAGALAATRAGAQPSLPSRQEVDKFLAENS